MTKIISVFAILFMGAMPAWADWPAASAELGARDHPKILQRFGGEIQNPALSAYVAAVGAQIVAVSEFSDEDWHFTVLDSAEVNAFALPGGYIYVTRGLLALANNESELAAVLAHEITHVVEAHVEARLDAQADALVDGAVSALVTGLFGGGENRVGDAVRNGVETALGQIGAYSKEQEFAADAGGIALLRAAGYRPAAQADFLATMSANAALKAQIAGREYNEAEAPFFANHPAPAERQLQALALAGDSEGRRGTEEFLAQINGMIYGESARGGFIRGQSFVHTELGFYFNAADGLRIQNAARQINILGPNRSTLIMSGGRGVEDLRAALQAWTAQIPRQDRQSRSIENLREIEINGMEAATGTLRIRKRGQRSTLRLTVIRFNGGLIRFAGTVQRGDDLSAELHDETIRSFNRLSEEGAAEYLQLLITTHRVEAGETIQDLWSQMAVRGYPEEVFRVINGLSEEDELVEGQMVKLVSY